MSLKPDLEEKFRRHREEYIRVALSTDSVDKEVAEKCIRQLYATVNPELDPKFYFCRSPLGIAKTVYIAEKYDLTKLDGMLQKNPDINTWFPRHFAKSSDTDNNEYRNALNQLINLSFHGQFDVYWVAYYQFFRKYMGVTYKEQNKVLDICDELNRACSWWVPYEEACFVSEKPVSIHINERNQLHKDMAPAMAWPDGFELYYLNGVRMPRDVVLTPPENIDPTLIIRTTNAEVRREMIRKVGYEIIGKKLGMVDEDTWREYTLVRVTKEGVDVEPIKMLKFPCPSTGKGYFIRVSPKCTTAREAVTEMNNGIDPERFLVEQ